MATQVIWVAPLGALLLGYLLGSIPFGVLLTRWGGAGDIRQVGSGNIGATNVLRTGRKGLAAGTVLLDMGKGVAAVLLVRHFSAHDSLAGNEPLAAIAAFIGHCYPVWLRGRGGKGAATLFGVAAALHWPVGLVYAAVWLLTLGALRVASLASILAALSAPVAAAMVNRFDLVPLFLAAALILVWKHGANIERLLAGTEPRVGRSAE